MKLDLDEERAALDEPLESPRQRQKTPETTVSEDLETLRTPPKREHKPKFTPTPNGFLIWLDHIDRNLYRNQSSTIAFMCDHPKANMHRKLVDIVELWEDYKRGVAP